MQGVPPVSAIVELTMPFTSVCDGFHLPASMLTEAAAAEENHMPSCEYALQTVVHIHMYCVSVCMNADLLHWEPEQNTLTGRRRCLHAAAGHSLTEADQLTGCC